MASMGARFTGDWEEVRKRLNAAPSRFKPALKQAILQEANFLRGKMVKLITSGQGLAPNSRWTRVMKGSSKPLINSGALLGSIGIIRTPNGAFVGVRRKAKSSGKIGIVNLALIHERGATINLVVTKAMRRFFMAATKKVFGEIRPPRLGKRITIKIPARPFISPIIEKHAQSDKVKARVAKRFGAILNADYGLA